jgi:DnaA-homolog protein
MKQVTLDLALMPMASFENFYPGPNEKLLELLKNALIRLSKPVQEKAGFQFPGRTAPFASSLCDSVLLCGERGSGKTHLLKACAQWARVHGLEITEWPIQSSLNASTTGSETPEFEFKSAWRLMIMDDVHLMNGSDQARAFNWFVNASSPGDSVSRLILMSSAQSVANLQIREDLRTRMAQGLCLELKTLDEQACRAVLTEQAKLRGLHLKADVLEFMMTRFSRDLSNLVGWLEQLDAFSMQTQRPITIPLIKDMLNEL